ncbi:hypothetical protein BHE74_00051207 [Ensete ventricosum]|nr:hypothetical protein BHE74_00051207 [Ensete ventricosum]
MMHPLRFPNCGIRAKQRQRGGGAASHGQVSCKGQPATAKAPYKGAVGHGQSPCRGSRQHARPPVGMAGASGQGCHLQGRSLLQGQRSRKAASPAAKCHPRAATPVVGAAAHADGVQRRRLRRAMVAAA